MANSANIRSDASEFVDSVKIWMQIMLIYISPSLAGYPTVGSTIMMSAE